MTLHIAQQTCRKCGFVALEKGVRFRCPECHTENRPNRQTLPTGRAHTETLRDLSGSKRHLRVVTPPNEGRPKTRGECADGPRPCPWVSCRHHLAYEISPAGGLKEKFPGLELEDMPETCSLDVADSGPAALDSVGYLMNVTQERVRQIEAAALDSFRSALVFTKDDI
jgi:hypothetical protein